MCYFSVYQESLTSSVYSCTASFCSVCCRSVAQSCLTLCNPIDCSTPGLLVHHQRLESTQTHVHWVSDAIQPSHPLTPSSSALNLSQHQGLFQWVSCSHQVTKILELQLRHPSYQISGLISLKIDWFYFLAVQETLRSLLQYRSSKASTFLITKALSLCY